jgi:hypothetical protein
VPGTLAHWNCHRARILPPRAFAEQRANPIAAGRIALVAQLRHADVH